MAKPKIDRLDVISLGFYRQWQNVLLLETPLDSIEDGTVADRIAESKQRLGWYHAS